MKKIIFLVSFPFLALMLIGCPNPKFICPQGMEVTLPTCTKLIKYDAGKLDIKGVSLTIPTAGTTVSIAGVTWNREKLQTATNAAMMLDNQNYQRCHNLPTYLSVCKNDMECRNTVIDYRDREEIMNQFAMAIEANNPKAVDRWFDMYFTKQAKLTKGMKSVEQQSVLKKNVKAKPRAFLFK